jgi:hypothetical protein
MRLCFKAVDGCLLRNSMDACLSGGRLCFLRGGGLAGSSEHALVEVEWFGDGDDDL